MIIDNPSEGLSLELDRQKDWVFQARKILGEHSVSSYGLQYFLQAVE